MSDKFLSYVINEIAQLVLKGFSYVCKETRFRGLKSLEKTMSRFIKEDEDDDEEGSLKDFIDDGGSSEEEGEDSDIQELDEAGEEKKKTTTRQDKVCYH